MVFCGVNRHYNSRTIQFRAIYSRRERAAAAAAAAAIQRDDYIIKWSPPLTFYTGCLRKRALSRCTSEIKKSTWRERVVGAGRGNMS